MCVYICFSLSLTIYLFTHSSTKVIDVNSIMLQIMYLLWIQYQFLHTKDSVYLGKKNVQHSKKWQFLLEEYMLFMLLDTLIKFCVFPLT